MIIFNFLIFIMMMNLCIKYAMREKYFWAWLFGAAALVNALALIVWVVSIA